MQTKNGVWNPLIHFNKHLVTIDINLLGAFVIRQPLFLATATLSYSWAKKYNKKQTRVVNWFGFHSARAINWSKSLNTNLEHKN